MPGITGMGTTFNLPNYHGQLFGLTPEDTPLLSARNCCRQCTRAQPPGCWLSSKAGCQRWVIYAATGKPRARTLSAARSSTLGWVSGRITAPASR